VAGNTPINWPPLTYTVIHGAKHGFQEIFDFFAKVKKPIEFKFLQNFFDVDFVDMTLPLSMYRRSDENEQMYSDRMHEEFPVVHPAMQDDEYRNSCEAIRQECNKSCSEIKQQGVERRKNWEKVFQSNNILAQEIERKQTIIDEQVEEILSSVKSVVMDKLELFVNRLLYEN